MTKKDILEALARLPEEATFEDAMYRLYVLYKIEQGEKAADAGQKMSLEEARARVRPWLQ